jgi:hypothetical protein
MSKPTRVIWRVQFVAGRWRVLRGKRTDATHATKASAVHYARAEARQHHAGGGLAQVVVHGKDGAIQTEHTYGADPRRSKG